ncbi:hypothetical protein ES288_D07G135000v1 [Gossypium darwinii]|uniref:Uncharacterized protein n=1 Tax=Gossypium darwinii TaxID=34276 RepID=A0A5D2BZL0_GOSDA|nr:hypothetical protein ES288_D07G135000v1 [Gossypium darwinii]
MLEHVCPIPPFGSPFTNSGVLLLHSYSLSSCNRYSGVLAWNSYSPFSSSHFETKIAWLLLPQNFPSILYPQIKLNRFAFIFFQPKVLALASASPPCLRYSSFAFIILFQHVPKINGVIPSFDEETSDHQRLLDRLQLYGLVENKVQGDGNYQEECDREIEGNGRLEGNQLGIWWKQDVCNPKGSASCLGLARFNQRVLILWLAVVIIRQCCIL